MPPKTRRDCLPGGSNAPARTDAHGLPIARRCPHTSCRYHLLGDRKHGGRSRAPSGDETCALDVADRGSVTLEEAGALMGVTRERVRQIEARALHKALRRLERRGVQLYEA